MCPDYCHVERGRSSCVMPYKMKVSAVLKIFFSVAVLARSFATGQVNPGGCPAVCLHCSPEHQLLNGTVFNLTTALCKWRSGEKLLYIPSSLPLNLGVLMMTSQNVQILRNTSLKQYSLLHRLYLDKNGLRRIEDSAFSRQRYLKVLDLKDNNLVNISKDTFYGLSSLETVRLDHNSIDRIVQGTFQFAPSIKHIDLQKNNINVLEEGAFDKLDHLETLLLNYNSLTTIHRGSFGNVMSLTQLELGFNRIWKFDGSSIGCAPLINNLTIRNNRLKEIPRESIRHLTFLKFLELSGNPISSLEADAFTGLGSLKTLDLSDCNISSIQSGAYNGLERLKIIRLKGNPLNCDCHLSWLRKWLSRKPDVVLSGAICRDPPKISGLNFTAANLSSFVCSCDACAQDAACTQKQKTANCSCSQNWAGFSCDDVCQLPNTSASMCRNFDGKCICSYNSKQLLQTQNEVNCSFNITSEICSENGEVKKSGGHLECVCNLGFTGDGVNCSDIDECAMQGGTCSDDHADCINTPGSYHCACHKGFKDRIPGLPLGMACVDIDECNELRDEACHLNAACKNTPGSYSCYCLPGFDGDGKTCLPTPNLSIKLEVTAIGRKKAAISWTVVNSSIISHFTVKYKRPGIHGEEWEQMTVSSNPHQAKYTLNLTDLVPDSSYVLRIGVFSIFNTSAYSHEEPFSTAFSASSSRPNTNGITEGRSAKAVILAVGLAVAVAVFICIGIGLRLFMKKRKKRSRNTNPQYVPGLEDLIEMRTHSHSGGPDTRLTREFLEHGSTVSYPGDFTDEWEVTRDKLVIGQKIGEGQFGLVLEGTLMTDNGPVKVAVKTTKERADRFDFKDLIQEMEMMKEIGQHPHVVSLLGACTTPGPLYIITEYISGGNLLDYLRSSRPSDETYVNIISTLSSRDLLKIALDVARGMNHIARKKFVHRDLAARNVLLTEDHEAKVADFGLTRDIYGDGQYVKTGGGRVPIKWMAPESIKDQIYTTKSDVWAFGVLLWEIVTIGGSPYPCVPVYLLLSKLLSGYRMSKPAHCSEELHDLMKTCWLLDPEARPTFSEICDSLSDMLLESARSYVNITISDEGLGPEQDVHVMNSGQQEQSTAV